MQQPSFDPGLTQQVTGALRRAINKDGSFNVQRRGGSWRDAHPYLLLINMSWTAFFGVVFLSYLAVNTVFALIYFRLAPGQVTGIDAPTTLDHFLNSFFFSAHTLTTVGYGNFSPNGIPANFLAAFEAMLGVLGFAVAAGLFFGRFSKPSARIGFSEKMLVAPYQDRTSLQFRIVNLRRNALLDLNASLILMTVEGLPGRLARKFQSITLERDQVNFLALTWTIVHPIDEASPLFQKTQAELEKLQAEILILIKAFDETFSQTVNARYSYRYDELEWGAKFSPAFQIDSAGEIVLDVEAVGKFTMTGSLPVGS